MAAANSLTWFVDDIVRAASVPRIAIPGDHDGLSSIHIEVRPDSQHLVDEIHIDVLVDPLNAAALRDLVEALGCAIIERDAVQRGIFAPMVAVNGVEVEAPE
ncbi:MAG: hypothetical protein AB7R89_28775 [Dehalococcoidia bacterium]